MANYTILYEGFENVTADSLEEAITKAKEQFERKVSNSDIYRSDVEWKNSEQDATSKAKTEALSLLKSLEEDCNMAISGEWDCSTDEGKEGFESMIDSIGTIEGIINKYIK